MQPGERIAIMSRTRYEWTLVDYAIWYAGAVSVPIYETSSPEQVQWNLSDSGSVAIFLESEKNKAVFGKEPPVRENPSAECLQENKWRIFGVMMMGWGMSMLDV